MTVLKGQDARAAGSDSARKLVVGAIFTLVGVAAGLGIGQIIDIDGPSAEASFSGPLVERSVAMQGNINALIESGQAQTSAFAQTSQFYGGPLVDRSLAMDRFYATFGVYSGPMVDRSLAMDSFYGLAGESISPMVERSLAMDRFYAGGSGGYSGPLVDRSLAMDRQIDALVESGKAQAAALADGE